MPSASGATGCSSCRASASSSPKIGDMVPEAFKQDRAKMSGSTFSTEAMKALAPFARDQWRAHAELRRRDARGRTRLHGRPRPGAADIHAYMNFWWIKAAIPARGAVAARGISEIDAWCARIAAIGHGDPRPMDAKEALAVAKSSTSDAREAPDPSGRLPARRQGDGRGGRLRPRSRRGQRRLRQPPRDRDTAATRRRWATSVVHFPRAGFTVAAA